jgi:hypothetical protein
LHEEGGAVGVEPQRDEVDRRVVDKPAQPIRLADGGERMQVGDEVVGLDGRLLCRGLQGTGRLMPRL